MAEKRVNSGTLSRNAKRESDRQPEFKGSAVVDGVAYWISGWIKEGQDGKFFSLAFTAKEKSQDRTVSAPGGGHNRGVPDSEIPFGPEWR